MQVSVMKFEPSIAKYFLEIIVPEAFGVIKKKFLHIIKISKMAKTQLLSLGQSAQIAN